MNNSRILSGTSDKEAAAPDSNHTDTDNPYSALEDMDFESEDTSKTPITGNAKQDDVSIEDDNTNTINDNSSSSSSSTSPANNDDSSYTPNLSNQAKRPLILPEKPKTLIPMI